MNAFVLNCGSSSVKFQIINTDLEAFETDADKVVAKGLIEWVGTKEATIKFEAAGGTPFKAVEPLEDHRAAILRIQAWLETLGSREEIHVIGHRVVHGAEKFSKSVLIDKEVIAQIEECTDLAPLHNPANLKGIHACYEIFGDKVPQVAVFDTAFHSTMAEETYLYAIPYEFYTKYRVRRYGFHGTSHRYVAGRYQKLSGRKLENSKLITLHLGNGSSACAIKNGRSVNTSMGLTPLEGLVMGTRSGDIDPAIVEYLVNKKVGDVTEVFNILNKKSGVAGISGLGNDMRDIEKGAEEGKHGAKLALRMFSERIRRYVGAYMVEMNGCDAIIFTAGVGENGPISRTMVCENLDALGIELDEAANEATIRGKAGRISKPGSKVEVWVIPTNEELLLARDAVSVFRSNVGQR